MSKAFRYSLWLVPDRDSERYRSLCQLIRDVSAKYSTPTFDPHVTLLGGIEGPEQDVCNSTLLLAQKLTPYEIQLGDIGSNGIYFQILFSRVEQTDSVLHANAVAQEVFGVNKGKYFPHFSFAYGDLSSDKIIALQQFIKLRYPIPIKRISFFVKNIELWRTEGIVDEWYLVATIPLGMNQ